MKIQTDCFNKCILCKKNLANSWEHIIPKSIGGRLQVKILCSHCNNTIGSELISKVIEDPSIRFAIKELRNETPELFETMENGQIYNAMDANKEIIKMKYKNGRLEIVAHKKEDDSIIIGTEKAIKNKNIEKILEKDGLSKNEIKDKIQFFEKLKDNKIVRLSKNTKIVKWPIEPKSIFPNLQGSFVDEKVIALIAYEFLSLLIGNLIYKDRFDFIREFIMEGKKSEKFVIERLTSRHYSPYHKIYFELPETEIVINIILFRWLVYKVHFKDFKLLNDSPVYLEDLKNRKVLFAKSVSEAKKSNYYEL